MASSVFCLKINLYFILKLIFKCTFAPLIFFLNPSTLKRDEKNLHNNTGISCVPTHRFGFFCCPFPGSFLPQACILLGQTLIALVFNCYNFQKG